MICKHEMKIAIIFDHRVPAESSKTATRQKKVREFVSKQGITKFHDLRSAARTYGKRRNGNFLSWSNWKTEDIGIKSLRRACRVFLESSADRSETGSN